MYRTNFIFWSEMVTCTGPNTLESRGMQSSGRLERGEIIGGGSPLVSAVVSKISEMIRAGTLTEGQGMPSERKLALEFSVSRGVIRAAIRELTEMGLLESKPRCRPIVRPVKISLPTGRRHICIWLWPGSSDYSSASILNGIQSTALGADVRLVIGHAAGLDWESRMDSEAAFLQSLTVDPEETGAIIWYLGGDRNRGYLDAVRRAGVPVVFLDRLPPKGFASDFVGTNNISVATSGVEHLIALGHRRIGLITNMEPVSSVKDREAGFSAAMQAAGIPLDPAYIQRDSVDEPEGVEIALDALLSLEFPPTAIFCINDLLALQVYEAIYRRGLTVPGDISVLGFDGLLRWLPGGGYLTTMAQDFRRIGQLAAELIQERMANGVPEAYTHLLLDAPRLDRGSTGAKPIFIRADGGPTR